MKKAKAPAQQIAQRPSVFWHPEAIGEKIEGVFQSWQETTLGNLAMKIKLDDETHKLVGMTTVLFNLFKENYKSLKAGSKVSIVFEGNAKRAKIYSAIVNGKALESSMSFPELPAGEVADYFSKDYEFKGKKSQVKGKK